jgi:Winged helix DNA-binding domain
MHTSALILSERLRRHRLIAPLQDRHQYQALFALLQPVAPIYFSYPGTPPRLVHRTAFDDGVEAERLRAVRTIVKGRFLGGTVGYVLAQDLELYARAFRRPLARLNVMQRTVLEAVQTMGGLTPDQIKEETGLRKKEIMPALRRLQEAFFVYEDQVTTNWDRPWYDFEAEWPDVDLEGAPWEVAAVQVLLRFLRGHVFATLEQMQDWSRWPARALQRLVGAMEKDGVLVPTVVDGLGEGWIGAEQSEMHDKTAPPSVLMLHKADVLVRSHGRMLQRQFGTAEVLQYLLIDGAFKGAVLGHWRIGPHDVEDIVVALPAAQRQQRQEEILHAVAQQYHPPRYHILKYDGRAIAGQ